MELDNNKKTLDAHCTSNSQTIQPIGKDIGTSPEHADTPATTSFVCHTTGYLFRIHQPWLMWSVSPPTRLTACELLFLLPAGHRRIPGEGGARGHAPPPQRSETMGNPSPQMIRLLLLRL